MQLDRCHTDLLVSEQVCATRVRSNSRESAEAIDKIQHGAGSHSVSKQPYTQSSVLAVAEIGALSDRTRSGERESVLIRLGKRSRRACEACVGSAVGQGGE
jgi:hypothetical protein